MIIINLTKRTYRPACDIYEINGDRLFHALCIRVKATYSESSASPPSLSCWIIHPLHCAEGKFGNSPSTYLCQSLQPLRHVQMAILDDWRTQGLHIELNRKISSARLIVNRARNLGPVEALFLSKRRYTRACKWISFDERLIIAFCQSHSRSTRVHRRPRPSTLD